MEYSAYAAPRATITIANRTDPKPATIFQFGSQHTAAISLSSLLNLVHDFAPSSLR